MAEIIAVGTPTAAEVATVGGNEDIQSVRQMVLSFLDEGERAEREAFLNVMADLKSIWMAAKDLHYNAKGEPFYGIHLLADMVAETDKFFDEIAEIYYMGEKGEPPPEMRDILARAIGENGATNRSADVAAKEKYGSENDRFLWRLVSACNVTVADVEKAKTTPGVLAGTQAVLDEISKTVLKDLGLLKRTDKKD